METQSPVMCFNLARYGVAPSAFVYICVVTSMMSSNEEEREPGVCRPLRRDAEMNRDRILVSAKVLFAARGLQVTLDEIADHAGVGVGTVYRRFPNKEILIEALFELRVLEVIALAHESLLYVNSWEGFVHLLEELLSREARDRGLREVITGADAGRHRLARLKEEIRPPIEKLVHRAQQDGYLRMDFRATDIPILSVMAGTAEQYCQSVAPGIWRRYLTIILDGLSTQRDHPSELPMGPLDHDQMRDAMSCWGRSPSAKAKPEVTQ